MIRLALVLILLARSVGAVTPDEVLADPALEARARAISQELRCPVCRNETIDESNAEVARDLRILVRERLVAGDSDDEVLAFVVDRYGPWVLLSPQAEGAGLLLWLFGPAALVLGGLIVWFALRTRPPSPEVPLSAEEERALAALAGDE